MSGPFTEDPRLPPPQDPRVLWRVTLEQHANEEDGRCRLCGDADCHTWRWASELLAEENRWTEGRAAAQGEDEPETRSQ
jgi:hypothetical protein